MSVLGYLTSKERDAVAPPVDERKSSRSRGLEFESCRHRDQNAMQNRKRYDI